MLKVGGKRVEAVVAVGDGGHGVLVLLGVVFCGDGRWEVGFIGYRCGGGHANPATRDLVTVLMSTLQVAGDRVFIILVI